MTAVMYSSVIEQLEKELREMWVASPGEPAKSRVCTLNLIVVTASEEIAEHYTRVVDEVTQTTPARSILVIVDPDAKRTALEGETSAVCVPVGHGNAICSERVILRARGAATSRVSSAVEALRVPEIPTVLVWLARVHTNDPIFAELSKSADRVILDTEYTSIASLLSLGKWARASAERPRVADIAWTRLSTWQEMCARFFDDPAHREHAHAIESCEIAQASEKGARVGSEAALLLGWLATRLGWKLDRIGGTLRFRRADGERVAVKLTCVPRPPGVAPNALASVTITSKRNTTQIAGTIRRQLATGHPGEPAGDMSDAPPMSQTLDADVLLWRLEVTHEEERSVIEQSIRLGANRSARLLDRTLHRPAHDPALDEAVEFAEELFEDGLTVT